MTYRVGNHQPQNVYRESDDDPCPASVDGRCAESGETHPPCKRGECRYDQTGARRGQYIGVMFTAEDAALVVEALNGDFTVGTSASGYRLAIGTLADLALRTGSPSARWCAEYLDADPDGRTAMLADSCTCTKAGPTPGCPVHQGRRARGPKPPPLGEGCICDGSGRTCPRHGAVI